MAFCRQHIQELENCGFHHHRLREFIKFCGADPDHYSKESQQKVDKVLSTISTNLKNKLKTSAEVQNTSSLLDELNLTVSDFRLTGGLDFCNK